MGQRWPGWVSPAVRHYLAHTEGGQSIRSLARAAQCHASTVLRQVRRTETLRDDPLVDAALRRLVMGRDKMNGTIQKESAMTIHTTPAGAPPVTTQKLRAEGLRILRRLSETGAVLAIAQGMEMGVVVRESPDGDTTRTAVVDQAVAQAMALSEWIACDDPDARISRYRITAAGRAELRGLMASSENGALGFAEGQVRFEGASPVLPQRLPSVADSPLAALARRKEKDGTPFLPRDLVAAGERLREDFELAQIDGADVDWMACVGGAGPQTGPAGRVAQALCDLGPGLGDVALRCCCFLEGMEIIEKKMGWCARSGKVVLRIALTRLKRHYEDLGDEGQLIG